MGCRLGLTDLVVVRIPVPVFWGDLAGVEGFLGFLSAGTAEGVVVAMGSLSTEPVRLTRWSLLW
jgi:hypothetical protein